MDYLRVGDKRTGASEAPEVLAGAFGCVSVAAVFIAGGGGHNSREVIAMRSSKSCCSGSDSRDAFC